jgi:putative transposase
MHYSLNQKYIASKDQKIIMQELRIVYSAPTEEAALIALDKLEETWIKKYSLVIKTWRNNWSHPSTFFKYPDGNRRIIYTTNAVEAVHRQFRKVTKSKSIFQMMIL